MTCVVCLVVSCLHGALLCCGGESRGNRYESGLLKKISARGSLREDEYRWSTQDM